MMGEKIISKQTEKEKMLAGELYFAMDEELWREHNHAQNILMKFNNSPDENRSEILKELFGKTGENFCVKPNFRCDYGYNIHVGENFFANYDCVILDVCKVTIGDNCLMAPRVCIYTATHPLDVDLRISGLEYGKPVTIGNKLVNQIISDAKDIGYHYILLDTLPFLQSSIYLYKKLGFYEIEKYNCENQSNHNHSSIKIFTKIMVPKGGRLLIGKSNDIYLI